MVAEEIRILRIMEEARLVLKMLILPCGGRDSQNATRGNLFSFCEWVEAWIRILRV
jgi:hypothetical protein